MVGWIKMFKYGLKLWWMKMKHKHYWCRDRSDSVIYERCVFCDLKRCDDFYWI